MICIFLKFKKLRLPICMLYLAWAYCISSIIVCNIFLMIYGLKLGRVETKKWLISITVGYLQNTIVIEPIKTFAIIFILVNILKFDEPDTIRRKNVFSQSIFKSFFYNISLQYYIYKNFLYKNLLLDHFFYT